MSEENNNQASVEAMFAKFLEKFQKPEDGALKLFGENYDIREKSRAKDVRIAELEKLVPGEGAVVFSKADAARLDALKEHGNLDEIKTKLTEAQDLRPKLAALEKQAVFNKVAEAGYKASVVKDFDTLEGGLEYEVRDETKDGKTIKTVYVKKDGKETPYDVYASERRPDLLPALKADAGAQTTGARLPHQSATGDAPKSVVDEFIEQRDKRNASRPNPFSVPATVSA